jgi:hypothetical protein
MAPFAMVVAYALLLALGVLAQSPVSPPSPPPPYPGERLVFADDFDSGPVDRRRWRPELSLSGFGNWEFQTTTSNSSNVFTRSVGTRGGALLIKPTLSTLPDALIRDGHTVDIWGTDPPSLCTGPAFWGCVRSSTAGGEIINPVVSARLRTAESFAFKYCRVEVVARLPRGDWLWPAIWLLPKHQSYGPWPASGEIDIMESRGNDPSYPPGGRDKFGSTLHVGPFAGANMWPLLHKEYAFPGPGDLSSDFHTYGLRWTPLGITTYFDTPDNVVLRAEWGDAGTTFGRGAAGGYWDAATTSNPWASSSNPAAAPFDQEFYLILNGESKGAGVMHIDVQLPSGGHTRQGGGDE